jgi:hypothetical protein
VDCLFGAVSVERPLIDWSCCSGDLAAAAGQFAVGEGLVAPAEGITRVRIRQANTGRRLDAFVPVRQGEVIESGGFQEDGVPFPSSEVRVELLDPAGGDPHAAGALLPTGNAQDELQVHGVGRFTVTMIAAGDPTVFVRADALGLTGRELPIEVARDRRLLRRLDAIRAAAAQRMGLGGRPADPALDRPGGPRICWVARPSAYRTSAGVEVCADRIDLLARIAFTQGLLQACTGTDSIVLAVAAALPGTVVAEVSRTLPGVPTRIGHVSGTLAVGADVVRRDGRWQVDRAVLSHGARRLMSGWVHAPSAGDSPRA